MNSLRATPAAAPGWRSAALVLAAIVLAAVALAGCTAIGGGDGASTAVGGEAGPPVSENGGSPDSSGGGALGEDIDTGLPFTPEILDRAVITTADITVRSADVTRDAERAAQLVATAGGQISGDVRGGVGVEQTADLVLRVPPGAVDDVLAGLSGLGEELSRSVRSEDVTTVVADVDSRVASLEASLDRLRGLIADATDITDLVTLERELAGRETELESLQAQQRALNDQVALATLTLHLLAEQAEEPGDEPAGFIAGLAGGWDAFVTVGVTLLTGFGTALPFLVTATLLVGVVVLVARRRRRPVTTAVAESA
ncbi:MAG: DUF4349 domain-containing protein [Geodermatophilaceae bacterium]|nr:DUF4349 domain-containing protein [Geodermatophilaceae bacterium]